MKTPLFWVMYFAIFPLVLFGQKADNTPDINTLVSKMTLEQKAKLVVGMRMWSDDWKTVRGVPGAAGITCEIPELGIPSMVLADGPAGLRIHPIRKGDSTHTYYATAFPIATLLASSWDTSLVTAVGKAMGNEVLEYGVDIILMPALNLHRNPLCGRNFEYYSEDPLLNGSMAAAIVSGIQSNGVGTSVKHFVANNQETNRGAVNAVISERALRELYLKGFEIAIKHSHPWTVMSSYNKVNGTYTSESHKLITEVLRDDWGFDGFVMTDWHGGKDAVAQMNAGNDLLMPGKKEQTEAIMEAVEDGELDPEILDTNVKRILKIIFRSPAYKKYQYTDKPDLKTHAQVSRQAATGGMVLLKNEKKALPLTDAKRIALFGNTSYKLFIGGTGSGDVNEAYSISLDEGLINAGYTPDEKLKDAYTAYIKETREKLPKRKDWFHPEPAVPEMPAPISMIDELAENADIALITVGRNSGEGADRKIESDFYLNDTEKELIASVSKAFHARAKKVVVVLNIGGVIDVASWQDNVDAILLAWQPGQEAGNAITDVLNGQVNPSGKLPMTFPIAYEDVPSAKNFPGIPADKPDRVLYEEDLMVGYRYFNTEHIKPAYAFGYGLSYTRFNYADLKLSSKASDDPMTASVTVTNTGQTAGKEVVQLYISAPSQKLPKPESELRAFAKTRLLQPGESQTVTFRISPRDLASYDTSLAAWLAEKGQYTVKAGSSSLDIRQTASFDLGGDVIVKR